MATVTKIQPRHIPAYQRYVIFISSTDLNDEGGAIAAGDVLQIEKSLGRPAREISVEVDAASDLEIKLNTIHTIFPPHAGSETTGVFQSEAYSDLSNPVTVVSEPDNIILGLGSDAVSIIKGPIADVRIDTSSAGTWVVWAY